MIEFNIPGKTPIKAEYLVLDYNGTLAIDVVLISGFKERLSILADKISTYVITADTYGKAQENLKGIPCQCLIINDLEQQLQKMEFVSKLGLQQVIAIGNGSNDALMLKSVALGIIVIQKEGASVKSLINADIICTNIIDALDLLINPLRIAATLRI